LVTARLRIDDGAVLDAEELLEALMARAAELRLTEDDVAFVHGYLMICRAYRADAAAAEAVEKRSSQLLANGALTEAASSFLVFAQSAIAELIRGDYAEALGVYLRVGRTEAAPRAVRFHSTANAGLCMVRLGQLARAKDRLEGMLEHSRGLELNLTHASACHGLGLIDALESRMSCGIARLDSAVESFRVNPFAHATGLCERSEVKRAAGYVEEACADAEEALEVARDRPEMLSMAFMTRAEWCAARFAAGDRLASVSEAQSLSDTLTTESHARQALLSAESILASAAYEDGQFDEAVVRMTPHEPYITSENANLWLATWTRTFPAFLPVVAAAVGPDRLPSHMLRLIDEESAREGLRESWVHLERDQWETLAHRLLSDGDCEELQAELRESDSCRVRFFGGLEVEMPSGVVPDSRWRKRKARLLFAMLAVRRGQDVPRDVLLEYLWPEMDDERARNNFYVVWNALRSALDPDGSLVERCEYVESRGGICRSISESVRTDLDEFDACAQQLREAEVSGDARAAASALEALGSVYVGDLLPGDVYDDWFGETREHYRCAFVDLVVRGSRMLREAGDRQHAAEALRGALVHDPVNEDAFRELLRCQIEGGQRTAAIETYMTCRERLAESLGLDPSEETSALYGDILAMEDSPIAEPDQTCLSAEVPGVVDPAADAREQDE
jgi:DNA-binding SARP family transcriptional activator